MKGKEKKKVLETKKINPNKANSRIVLNVKSLGYQ